MKWKFWEKGNTVEANPVEPSKPVEEKKLDVTVTSEKIIKAANESQAFDAALTRFARQRNEAIAEFWKLVKEEYPEFKDYYFTYCYETHQLTSKEKMEEKE